LLSLSVPSLCLSIALPPSISHPPSPSLTEVATMQFCAHKLDRKDFFGKSDPFLVFYRSNEDGTFTICHKTEVVKNTLNPVWQAIAIPVRALCNGDFDRTIKAEVYDWDRDGSHDFIGEFTTSYRDLSRGQSQFNVYEVSGDGGNTHPIVFTLKRYKYITQIHFTVAIDFTASNGNPSQSTSLHYMNPYQMNAYAMALKAVGEIIQDYDSDKMFPALGFGAKLPPDGQVSHEFPLVTIYHRPMTTDTHTHTHAHYRCSLGLVELAETQKTPCCQNVDNIAWNLLVVCSPQAAKLPMSIIIVGVGHAEFDAMVELDGDDIRISSRGKLAERDIVQFVPFRDYMDRTGNHVLSMARLAKDVLAEIPEQLILYMKNRGIKPSPHPPQSEAPTLGK
uniref:C2 domain-containing protein n=1 Tax=Hucho hucho TaxID=62062 RepID=A0A4W5QD83_9TELE